MGIVKCVTTACLRVQHFIVGEADGMACLLVRHIIVSEADGMACLLVRHIIVGEADGTACLLVRHIIVGEADGMAASCSVVNTIAPGIFRTPSQSVWAEQTHQTCARKPKNQPSA
jgi:hypothetical protein